MRRGTPPTLADNSGALTIRIITSTPVDQMTWSVPANAGAGVTSPGALAADETYLVTVSGTVAAGGGVLADAECSTTPADPVWRRNRVADPAYPGAERLDVLVDKQATTLTAVTDSNGSSCDVDQPRLSHRPAAIGHATDQPARRRPDPAGQHGCPDGDRHPRGAADRARDGGTGHQIAGRCQSARIYLAGSQLRITAVGTYTFGPGTKADAECTSPTAKPNWTNVKGGPVDGSGNTLGDVTVAGHSRQWQAAGGKSCDAATHTYTLTYTPSTTGPLSFGVADTSFSDNAGTMAITVVPVG